MKSAKNELFHNLFILEAANNHWGKVDRGLQIIREHGSVARYNGIKTAIKLQFRDVDSFIHPEFKNNSTLRYIKKTEATAMAAENYAVLVKAIRNVGCIPMATPFDERSVDLCVAFDMPIIKVASSDINDWPLLEKIASTRLPTIVSSGGASEKQLDDVVTFFERRNIPLAINHCVSLYPTEEADLELNQIDYLCARYPEHVIGLSSHEYLDWEASMYISYAKGARTWERHIDIDADGVTVSPYCSTPEQVDVWFKAYQRARTMCGGSADGRRTCSSEEIKYLDALVRGVFAKKEIPDGLKISSSNFDEYFYMAVPLLKGQLSCRDIVNGDTLIKGLAANEPLTVDHVDSVCATNPQLRKAIESRGIDRQQGE